MLPSAKAGKAILLNKNETLVIIDDETYASKKGSISDMILDAIESHIEKDKAFPNWLTVLHPNKETEKFFVPAILCGFNYLSITEFMEAAIDGVIDEQAEDADGV